jgi:hypothetical protein
MEWDRNPSRLDSMAELSPWDLTVEAYTIGINLATGTPAHRDRRGENRHQMNNWPGCKPQPGDAIPLCACGCGESVKSKFNGIFSQWRPGHSSRGRSIA